MDEFQSQIGLALFVPYLLQWAKTKAWLPIASFDNALLNRITAGVIAVITGLGIALKFDTDAGVLTVTGLTAVGLWQGALHSVYQFMLQQGVYHGLIAPRIPGFTQAQIRDAAAAGTPVVPAVTPVATPPKV